MKARPSKIIAGLDPEDTNQLLQAIGSALEQKLDTTDYVKQFKKKGKPKVEGEKLKKTSKTSITSEEKAKTIKKELRKSIEASPKEKSKRKEEAKNSVRDKVIESVQKEKKVLKEKSKNKPSKMKERNDNETKVSKKPKEDLKTINQLESKDVTSKSIMEVNEDKVEINESKLETTDMTEIKTETDESKIETTEIETEASQFETTSKTETLTHEVDVKPESSETKILERPKSARPRSGDFKKDGRLALKLKQDTMENDIKIERVPCKLLQVKSSKIKLCFIFFFSASKKLFTTTECETLQC